MVLRKSDGFNELANVIAELLIALRLSTSPKARKNNINIKKTSNTENESKNDEEDKCSRGFQTWICRWNKHRRRTLFSENGGHQSSEAVGADSAFEVGLGMRDSEKRAATVRENEREWPWKSELSQSQRILCAGICSLSEF